MQSYYMSKSAKVRLDDYICDLNLEVAPGGYACKPLSAKGFSYMWAGCKATYGIRSGKVCFEAKILDYNDVTCQDVDSHVVRVGWSTDDATLQLGEDKNSFGFGGTGKKSVNRKFANYGRRYEKGDVVGCYLAMENGWVDISYTVNGRFCGSAFKIRWMTDEALFPHILSKNCKMEVNFGQANHPYFSLQPGYKLIDHVPPEFLIPAARVPASQNDCEIIMMVGLPGVGKSTWAMNYAKIHPSKKYVILGTDSIIDKMRVQGLHRKNNFSGRWDVLIKQASDCFNTLLKKASNLPRNLILDQTNVYASARTRKVKQYREKGYTINAMVLVPRDEDMIRRSEQRTIEEGKEVPVSAVMEMKANFSLPHEKEGLFDKITFLELQRDEAQGLVEQYNREANNQGYQSNKQKGQSRHMNQSERKTNRYFSDGPPQGRQQGFSSRPDYQNQTPMGPPQTKNYDEEMRGAKKRPDNSSNYGPPDKYRRSNSPSAYGRQPPGSQQYSSGYNPNDPYSGGPPPLGGPDQRGAKPQAASAVTPKPYVKEELGHPMARGDVRAPYTDDYGRTAPKNDGYNQYSNVKQDPSSYDNTAQAGYPTPQGAYSNTQAAYPKAEPAYPKTQAAFPRQDAYESGQSYNNDPYYSQNTNQQTATPANAYAPPGTDQYGYSEVKSEQNASDAWYGQGNQNYSSGDASSYQSVKAEPYQSQQGAYYDTSQQYGAPNKGYGAEVKSENWSGQPQPPQTYQQNQQYDRPASQSTNNQYGTANYDSYSDRSNNQQWNQNNANQGYYNQGNSQQQQYPGQQAPSSNKPPSNQYSDTQGYYGYNEPKKESGYDNSTAASYNSAYTNQGYGSEQYQDYNQPPSQPKTNQAYPPPPPGSGYDTKPEPQSWDTQGQYGQSQWDSGRAAPVPERSWEQPKREQPPYQRQPSPPPSRNLDRPMHPQSTLPTADTRAPDRQWSGQNQRPSRPSRFDVGPSSTTSGILPTPPGVKTEPPSQPDRRPPPPREESGRSPRSEERSRRPRPIDDSRSGGRRDEPPSRRGDREESRRGGSREDSHSRRGERDSSRRSERDDPPRRGDRSDPPRRDDKEGSRRSDRDDSRSRTSDRSRDPGRSRHDRDRSRGDERRSDGRASREDSSDRGRRDRPPPRDDRRAKDDRGRPTERSDKTGRPSGSSLLGRRPDDPKSSVSPSRPPHQNSPQKKGLLPLPNQPKLPSTVSPTEKAGLANLDSSNEQSIVEEATSKLSTVDFDKLKQSLVNLRKQNLKLTKEPSPPNVNQSAGSDDMEIVPDEEINESIVHTSSGAPPSSLMSLPPRRPPPPTGRGSLLGPRPGVAPRAPRPQARMEGLVRPGMRSRLPGSAPPRDPPPGLLGRMPMRSDAPRPSHGPSLLGNAPRRPLLETPGARQETSAVVDLTEEELNTEEDLGLQELAMLRAPRPLRPRMLRPRFRGPRPGGMRPMHRPGMRPRLRPPGGPRGYGRPPFMRGAPRRFMAPRLGPM